MACYFSRSSPGRAGDRRELLCRISVVPALPVRHGFKIQGFNKLETEFLTEEIFEDSCYIMPERIHIKEGDTVIDVGGNIGIFGLQAALAVGSTGRVISVEALPPTFELLKANQESAIHQGHVKARWTAINAAAGSSDGHMDMTFFPRAAGWGTSDPMQHRKRMRADLRVFIKSLLQDSTSKISQTLQAKVGRWLLNLSTPLFDLALRVYTWWMASSSRAYAVPARTLTTIFKENQVERVALLKVDVEGAELAGRPQRMVPSRWTCMVPSSSAQVLQGLSPREWAMIRQVVVEVHSDTLLQHVTAALNDHFACIVHEQGKRMRGTQLHMVYATCPKHPP